MGERLRHQVRPRQRRARLRRSTRAPMVEWAMDETRFHLELRGQLRPAQLPASFAAKRVELARQAGPDPALSRRLYESVGRPWRWVDRLAWTDDQWREYLGQDGTELWVLRVDGEPAGYFELAKAGDGSVEIVYFGLVPAFIGQGLGGYLLTQAVRRAQSAGATLVRLHTCTRDHPHALDNYQARGFVVVRTEPL